MNENNLWPGWQTTRVLGTGSFGQVYEIERRVGSAIEKAALKVIRIPQNSSEMEDYRNEGYDEASITARLKEYRDDIVNEYSVMARMKGHSCVVYCDDLKCLPNDDGVGWTIYIKMELLTPIMKVLSRFDDVREIIKLGRDISSALIACGKLNLVHRDIKPQNIFISKDGVYKLGDFGIAKTVEKTAGGTRVGTYDYMAPEVFHNEPYGAAADQYSLGMTMYWLLNRRKMPFLGDTDGIPTASMKEESRKKRFSGAPLPPPDGGSTELKQIVLKACAHDPNDRFENAKQLFAALQGLLQNGSVPAAERDTGADYRNAAVDRNATVAVRRAPGAAAADPQQLTQRVRKPVGPPVDPVPLSRQDSMPQPPLPEQRRNRIMRIVMINVTAVAAICLIVVGILLVLKSRPSEEADAPEESVGTVQEEQPGEAAEAAAEVPTQAPLSGEPLELDVGDTFFMGLYEQDDNNADGYEPIEWIVMHKDGNRAMLISRYALERKKYQNSEKATTWADSWLRTWLNGDFYYAAFSEEERARILPSTVDAAPNPDEQFSGVYAGENTTDNVFLLSAQEVEVYLPDDCRCAPTKHLIAQGAYVREGYCYWWLRNPGQDALHSAGITTYGLVDYNGEEVREPGSVRPAIWIDLS